MRVIKTFFFLGKSDAWSPTLASNRALRHKYICCSNMLILLYFGYDWVCTWSLSPYKKFYFFYSIFLMHKFELTTRGLCLTLCQWYLWVKSRYHIYLDFIGANISLVISDTYYYRIFKLILFNMTPLCQITFVLLLISVDNLLLNSRHLLVINSFLICMVHK